MLFHDSAGISSLQADYPNSEFDRDGEESTCILIPGTEEYVFRRNISCTA